MSKLTNLTKREIVLSIYNKNGGAIPQKTVVDVVQQTLDTLQAALAAGRTAELRNFGVLEPQRRKARIGRNPNNPGKDVLIPTRWTVKFKAGKILKAQLRKLPV